MVTPTYHFDPHTLREVADDPEAATNHANTLLAQYRAAQLSPEQQKALAPQLIFWLRVSGQYSRAEEVARTSLKRAGGEDILDDLDNPTALVTVPPKLRRTALRLAIALHANSGDDPNKEALAEDLFDACIPTQPDSLWLIKNPETTELESLSFALQHRAKFRFALEDYFGALRDANLAYSIRTHIRAANDLQESSQFTVTTILNTIEEHIEQQVNAAGASITTEMFAAGDRSGYGAVSGTHRIGPWLFWFKGGRVKSAGLYLNDQLHGPWVWFRERGGLLQEGNFVESLQEGPWVRYFANGRILDRGTFVRGEKVGRWEYFNEDGSLKKAQTHKVKKK
ncbi:toxin-antitoxin system YwqK family antitoxin [Timonella sp. A28]|uniref:toxin-antitoxin system YwqK family antitoxin n=1 Tax=Timonella sp. A28 TaxID=3442640 RepID=UPI003EB845BC